MTGGILQLAVYGPEDIFLTFEPQITFFKLVYRRHTNFSIETFELNPANKPNFGEKGRIKIMKLGDLVSKMYLRIVLGKVELASCERFAWIRRIGHAILKSVSVSIGGATIDKQFGIWLDVWYELARKGDHERGYLKLIGDVQELTTFNNKDKPEYTLFIPLQFWFNRYYGLALPIIGLHYQDVFIDFELSEKVNLIIKDENFNKQDCLRLLDVSVLIDYIFLDMFERNKFAILNHEYLIEQVQYFEAEMIHEKQKCNLSFGHPIKELIWVLHNGNYFNNKDKKFLCYSHTDDWSREIKKASKELLLNSIILLFQEENPPKKFFEKIEPLTETVSRNKKILVKNGSKDKTLWINTDSLKRNSCSITDKITATIIVTCQNEILIDDFSSDINISDVSIPINEMTDNRVKRNDVIINQFNNYGLLLNGKINPIGYSKLEINGRDRVERRNGNFFNYLQPEMHHSNSPCDGINVYSFALFPEDHQPSGTMNFSKIDKKVLKIWLSMPKKDINLLKQHSMVHCLALSYNIWRVTAGLSSVAY